MTTKGRKPSQEITYDDDGAWIEALCGTTECVLHEGLCADPGWHKVMDALRGWEPLVRWPKCDHLGAHRLFEHIIEATLHHAPWAYSFRYSIEDMAAATHENTYFTRGALGALVNLDIFREEREDASHGALTWNVRLPRPRTKHVPLTDEQRQARQRVRGELTALLKIKIYARDRHTCVYCGRAGGHLEIDHVLPVSRGGTSDLDNLVTACYECNHAKHAKTIEEWQAQLPERRAKA